MPGSGQTGQAKYSYSTAVICFDSDAPGVGFAWLARRLQISPFHEVTVNGSNCPGRFPFLPGMSFDGFRPVSKFDLDMNSRTNRRQPGQQHPLFRRKILELFGNSLEGLRIAVWGAGPTSRDLIDWLLENGAEVCIHSRKLPAVCSGDFARGTGKSHPAISRVNCHLQAVRNADALLVLDNEEYYFGVDPGTLKWYGGNLQILDLYDCLNAESFQYSSFCLYRSDDTCLKNLESLLEKNKPADGTNQTNRQTA